jgi:hypothetical protein
MEYLIAALVLLGTVAYAAVIAVNIEKGRSWALEIAQSISMLDPESANLQLRERMLEGHRPPPPEGDAQPASEPDRLAA